MRARLAGWRWMCGAALVIPVPMSACAGSAAQPCGVAEATECHAHIDLRITVSGSSTLAGDLQRDTSEGTLCTTTLVQGSVWSVPLPATPTPVDGHLVFGQGSILATDNVGPGTYHLSTVDGFELVIDDQAPFIPGSGTITIAADGSGTMALAGLSNGSAQVNASGRWTCEDLPSS